MKLVKIVLLSALLASSVGCAAYGAFQKGKDEEAAQRWDAAVLQYARAAELHPKNTEYRIVLMRAKQKASQAHFEKGKIYRSSGNPDLAVVELEQAVLLDPTNDYAEVELKKARDDAAKLAAERNGDTKLEALKKKTRGARAHPPMLEPASDRPISLNFPQPKPIKQIYLSLAAAGGINVIFDPQLKDDNVSIVLNNLSFQDALETLMRQENHFYKVIDEKTMLIAADTPANRKTYEDLVIRTFFLSNGDVTEVSNALRALLQTTRISINKAENSITLRDTADKVAIAERIIEQNDKQLAEVVVDVELLQINTSLLQDLGPILSPYSINAAIPAPGGTSNLGGQIPAGQFTWDQLKQISIRSFGFTLPSMTYNFIKNNTGAELLAKPQLRISEGQKAQLVIGDRTPIPVTTFNTGTTVGGNIVPVTSFQYQDVGIKIEVEPRVHHNREVTLKLTVEVSQLNGSVTFTEGQSQPIIGTRTISSNIRLKDGETNLLAGLFRRDKSKTNDQFPFLSDIPVLGRLLTHTKDQDATTDVVLTLTPHIIRIPDITEEDVTPVYVGTDANISYQGAPRVESSAGGGPFEFQRRQPQAAPAPQPAQPQPQNLVPGSGPTDPFARPQPPPTPPPQQQAVPQGRANVQPQDATDASVVVAEASPVYDIDPPAISLAPGEQKTIVVRATGDTLPPSPLAIRFDPAVVSVVSIRPIVDNGVADTRIEAGRMVLDLPGGQTLGGTKAVAEVTLQGVKKGRSVLSFDQAPGSSSSATVEVH